METKKGVGDVMNQLGIISELLDNVNLESNNVTVEFDLPSEEFDELHEKVIKRRGFLQIPKKTFKLNISGIEFTFKRS